jgi:hypothetical protein
MYCASGYFAPHYFSPVYFAGSGGDVVLPAIPNPRRTITPELVGWAGETFEDISDLDDDVFAFDLIDLLGAAFASYAAETIASVVSFDATVSDPNYATDGNALARALGSPSIIGTIVSQQFGNWVPGLTIRYRIMAAVLTSRGDRISCWSYVTVKPAG